MHLSMVDRRRKYFITNHQEGFGGLVVGILDSYEHLIQSSSTDPSNNWISINISVGDILVNLLTIYAPAQSAARRNLWASLPVSNLPSLLVGMVESLSDRWQGRGIIIREAELQLWDTLCSHLELTYFTNDSSFTWSNQQVGENHRRARLDRGYLSKSLFDLSSGIRVFSFSNFLYSYHKPVYMSIKFDSGTLPPPSWFKLDPVLLKNKEVKSEIETIWIEEFKIYNSPSTAWSLAMSKTSLFLQTARKRIAYQRAQRLHEITTEIELLELSPQAADQSKPKDLKNNQLQLEKEELQKLPPLYQELVGR